jgi:hypothetical protein
MNKEIMKKFTFLLVVIFATMTLSAQEEEASWAMSISFRHVSLQKF